MNFQLRSGGFTLIEVVVAVAIIAFGLGATIKTVSTVTKNSAHLNERIIATWVAQNAMAEFELDINRDAAKEPKGVQEIAGIEWHWQKSLEKTEDPDLKRVEISVRRDSDSSEQVYATLVSLHPTYFDRGNNGN